MNNVSLIGNISTDIDLRYTPNGHGVIKFNLAVTNPNNRDKTSFIPIEAWRKTAENTAQYCGKGSKIAVVGIIEVDNYEKDGQKRTFTKVVANNIEFLNAKGGNEQQNNGGNTNGSQSNQNSGTGQNGGYGDDPFATDGKPIEISDDDLPF